MLPICWEWAWDLGHFIFMGLLYTVITVVGLGVMTVVGKTIFQFISGIDAEHH